MFFIRSAPSARLFQDVEQATFNPAAVVPGIGFSPDKWCRDASLPMVMRNDIVLASTTS
jgi:hypothetical protein